MKTTNKNIAELFEVTPKTVGTYSKGTTGKRHLYKAMRDYYEKLQEKDFLDKNSKKSLQSLTQFIIIELTKQKELKMYNEWNFSWERKYYLYNRKRITVTYDKGKDNDATLRNKLVNAYRKTNTDMKALNEDLQKLKKHKSVNVYY